jgi:hypothetical protein
MQMKGWPSTVSGLAQAYEDFLDVLVIDTTDGEVVSTQQSAFSTEREPQVLSRELSAGVRFLATNTLMHTLDDKRNLATFLLNACNVRQSAKA